MVQLIVGNKGQGKTKCLLDRVNDEVRNVPGNIVYLDKNAKHMYELNNRIRLIVVPDFMISNADEFIGFVSGIISQDHDLQQIYLDSFLKIAAVEEQDVARVIERLDRLAEAYHVDFYISISVNEEELPESVRSKVVVAL